MAKGAQNRKERRASEINCFKRVGNSKTPVTFDNICKEVILEEKKVRDNYWPKYEFLNGEFFQKVLEKECVRAGFPVDTFKQKVQKDSVERSPIPLKASPYFPKTSSRVIGLRSSGPEYNLEFTGRMYTSPKWTIDPPLEPNEFRVTHQRFIFLG